MRRQDVKSRTRRRRMASSADAGSQVTQDAQEGEVGEDEEGVVRGVYHVRSVTKEDVEVKFIRSGGAGGQNVNKVNTKADVRLKIQDQDWIPDQVKAQLARRVRKEPTNAATATADRLLASPPSLSVMTCDQERNRVNKDGELVVASTKHRTQKKNLEDALGKVQRMLDDAVTSLLPIEANPVKEKKIKKKLRQANEKRLDGKKKHSMKKKERRRKDW